MIDEADEVMPGQATSKKRAAAAMESPPASPRPNKRKPGPLPRDVPASRLMSPTPEQMGLMHGPDSPQVVGKLWNMHVGRCRNTVTLEMLANICGHIILINPW